MANITDGISITGLRVKFSASKGEAYTAEQATKSVPEDIVCGGLFWGCFLGGGRGRGCFLFVSGLGVFVWVCLFSFVLVCLLACCKFTCLEMG